LSDDFTQAEIEASKFFKSSEMFMHPIRSSIALNKHIFDSKYFYIQLNPRGYGKAPPLDLKQKFKSCYFSFSTDSIFKFCPSKLFESMISGCIPIIFDTSYYSQLGLKHKVNCLVLPDNISFRDIPIALKIFCDLDVAELDQISINACDFANQHFSHETIANQLRNYLLTL
jgi:glycosyltransferase involved in cell wall biosynthesis